LKAAPALHRKPAKEENLISVYFDTPKHKPARNGVSLRVRHNGDKRLQTVKSEGSGGSFRRGEWEREIRGNVPDLRKAPGTALAPLLTNRLKRRLKPIFATNVHRTRIPVFKNGSRIEVALDEGEVRAGRQSASISELEFLKRGKASDVFKLGRQLAKLVPAKLELKSKAEHGYDLIEHKSTQAVRAEKIKLDAVRARRTPFASSFGRLCETSPPMKPRCKGRTPKACTRFLRQLRAAISVFSKLFGDKQTERIKSELNWLETEELSPARDLDVYERGTVQPLRCAAPATREMKELEHALASRRRLRQG
jgi:triphosphatase